MGLLTWRQDYDGVGTWAYQSGTRHIWNDFDDDSNRDFNLTYPTADGVVDTLAFEGFREGLDDVRYATTLRLAVEQAKAANDAGRQQLAATARQYLDSLEVVPGTDFDAVRAQVVDLTLRLKGL